MGRAGRVPGTRELLIPGTPYIIPYRVRAGAVEILRVFHAARRWPERFLRKVSKTPFPGELAQVSSLLLPFPIRELLAQRHFLEFPDARSRDRFHVHERVRQLPPCKFLAG